MSKDDLLSVAPSNGDSAYMSMADYPYHVSQDQAGQYVDSFSGADIYSPSLGSESQGIFPASMSEMGPFSLPPSAGVSDVGDFIPVSEVTHSPLQNFNRAGFVYQDSGLTRFSSQSGGPAAWSSLDLRDFTGAANPAFVEGNDLSNWDGSQHFSTMGASGSIYDTQSEPMEREFSQQTSMGMKPTQSRPRIHTVPLHRSAPSVSLTARSDTSVGRLSNNQSPFAMRRDPSTGEPSMLLDDSAVMSPASSYVTSSHTSLHMAAASIEDMNERSTTGSLMNGTIIGDDQMDESRCQSRAATRQTGEEAAARSHSLYQAAPQADDLYHCPFEAEDCGHKPTKLKCNYDKYVDSHLKPFRCKNQACVDVQFSSTACLLRHEREAHGMHGHGSKPHLCSYQDCERSISGNGFPRRYNLYDHMKRVHDFTGPTVSPTNDSAAEVVMPPVKRPASRKRKTSDSNEQTEKRSKAKARTVSAAQAAQDRRAKEMQLLQKQWFERRDSLQARLQSMQGPQDITSLQQSHEDISAMQRLAEQIHELG